MDIFTQLKMDHDQVKALFRKIEMIGSNGNGEVGARRNLFQEVRRALIAHSKAEDQTFYTELETDDELEDRIVEARQAHERIEQLLDDLNRMDAEQAPWTAKFKELVRNVEHHVEEEENEIFPLARQILDREDAEELGQSMRQLEDRMDSMPSL